MSRVQIKHNILFFPDKEGSAAEGYKPDAKLRIRIRWNKTNILNFNVGYRVDLAKWNSDTQRCVTGTTHGKNKTPAKEINSEIQYLEDIIESIFTTYELKNTSPTADEFRAEYHKTTNSGKDKKTDSSKTFFNYFDEFILKESQVNSWKYATLQKFSTVKSHLHEYDSKLTFDKLTKDGLNNYIIFLRDKKNLRNSSILKQIGFLKWFLKWSTGEGYNSNLAFTNFFPKLDTVDKKVIFLNWEELMHVYSFDFSKAKKKITIDNKDTFIDLPEESINSLEKVRDAFCFMCFTGLRYSDAANLRKSDISDTQISITTVKTSDALTIDLNKYSKAILNKYSKHNYPGNKALPVISNQKFNYHLKDMGEICGLDETITTTFYKGSKRIDEVYPKYELLTSHAGRRTFICNALALGIAPQVVMKFTGHASYSSMKPYIDIADTEKKNAMDLFNKR